MAFAYERPVSVVADDSSYSTNRKVGDFDTIAYTSVSRFEVDISEIGTGATSLTLPFTVLKSLIVQNTSSVVLTLTWTDGNANADTHDIPAGDWVKLVDVNPATAITLTAASGTANTASVRALGSAS